jgi:hypothetical protein
MAVFICIHTNHIGGDGTFAWCSDQHLLGTSLQMLTSTFLVNKYTSSLNDKVYSQFPAGNSSNITINVQQQINQLLFAST